MLALSHDGGQAGGFAVSIMAPDEFAAAAVRRSATLLDQSVSLPDALRGAMRNRQIEFIDQVALSEGGQGFAQVD